MGYWSLYFLGKLLLYAGGHLDLHPALNLAFAVFTALPTPDSHRRLAKNVVAWPLALLLLYYDSHLPPIARAVALAPSVAEFSTSYLLELAQRFVNLQLVAALLLLVVLVLALRRVLRLGTFAIFGILAAWALPPPQLLMALAAPPARFAAAGAAPMAAAEPAATDVPSAATLDTTLAHFFAEEAGRRVVWHSPDRGPDFDILLLHICSLSWDDLAAVGLEDDALWKRFHIVFSHFNSAASYSGPAAIRLLRANCGQPDQKRLYDRADPACLLITGIEDAGFEPHWLMNHDGHFGNFFADVKVRGALPALPDSNDGADAALKAFDGTPVYDDYSVLSRWWAQRVRNPAPRVVLYYNTVSLHDGNRLLSAPELTGRPSYRLRARRLFDGIGRLFDDIQASGRRAVVVLVAEHGAAVRGDPYQVEGLREIPTPAIANVPVGFAFLGPDAPAAERPLRLVEPVSYLALSQLLARIVANDPYAAADRTAVNYARALPSTEFVAENDGAIVMQMGGHVLTRTPDGSWSPWLAPR